MLTNLNDSISFFPKLRAVCMEDTFYVMSFKDKFSHSGERVIKMYIFRFFRLFLAFLIKMENNFGNSISNILLNFISSKAKIYMNGIFLLKYSHSQPYVLPSNVIIMYRILLMYTVFGTIRKYHLFTQMVRLYQTNQTSFMHYLLNTFELAYSLIVHWKHLGDFQRERDYHLFGIKFNISKPKMSIGNKIYRQISFHFYCGKQLEALAEIRARGSVFLCL